MDLYKRRNDMSSCRSILDSMTARRVAPNEVILNTFVAALAGSPDGTLEEALDLCETMQTRFGVQPSAISYHPLLAAAASTMTLDQLFVDATPRNRNDEMRTGSRDNSNNGGVAGDDGSIGAVAVLDAMDFAGVQATSRTLTTLLIGLVRSGRAIDAARFLEALVVASPARKEEILLKECETKASEVTVDIATTVHPTLLPLLAPPEVLGGSLTYSFNVVIGALVGAGHLERALALLALSDSIQSPTGTVALNPILKVFIPQHTHEHSPSFSWRLDRPFFGRSSQHLYFWLPS